MTLQIKDSELFELNGESLVSAFYECIKDMNKRRPLSILHLKDAGEYWDADLLECAAPNVIFRGIKIPKTGQAEDEVFIQLNYKTVQMVKDGSIFNINSDVITIKNNGAVIKEPYKYSNDEIKSMYESYLDTFEDETPVSAKLTLDSHSPLLRYIASILQKPDAFFYTKKNEANILVDDSMVFYTEEDLVDSDFYINCYMANRIANILSYTEKVELEISSNLRIKGYLGGQCIVINTSPIYEMPMDVLKLSDIEPIMPQNPIKVTISSAEFQAGFESAKDGIGAFIPNMNVYKFTKNGEGVSLLFKESFDKDSSDSEATIHIGNIDPEVQEVTFPDYKIYLPIKDLVTFAGGNIPLEFSYEDDDNTSFLVRLSDKTFIITGKN